MNLTKVAPSMYAYNDATVSSVYIKDSKSFVFEIHRVGYETLIVQEKNILVLSNKIASLYAGMTEVKKVESSVDIDGDLTEDEAMLAEFIRSYNPEAEDTLIKRELPDSQDEVLATIKNYLSSESEENYAAFRDALAEELVEKELAIL